LEKCLVIDVSGLGERLEKTGEEAGGATEHIAVEEVIAGGRAWNETNEKIDDGFDDLEDGLIERSKSLRKLQFRIRRL